MSVAEKTKLKLENIKPNIGARVLNTKEELLSGELADEIRSVWADRGVLVFEGINFTDEEQVAFTKTLGNFAPELRDAEGEEKTHPITLDEKINPGVAEYLKGSLFWHIDGTMNDVPILGSLLTCKKKSDWGGNTGFANTYAAYDALSDEMKEKIENLRVVHSLWISQLYHTPEPSEEKLRGWQSLGESELPLVWTHQDGRKSLVLGNTAHYIKGMNPTESAMLLHSLRDWATRDEFAMSYEWTVGDMVMWDNTGTMHRAEPYDPASGRLMVRTKLQGEEPFE